MYIISMDICLPDATQSVALVAQFETRAEAKKYLNEKVEDYRGEGYFSRWEKGGNSIIALHPDVDILLEFFMENRLELVKRND